MASTDEFWKICNDDGVCHCDWRLTIYGCEEEQQLRAMYIALAVLSGLVGVFAFMVLYHRVVYLKQQIFDMRTGYPRPKPIESMAVFGTIFNLLRMVHAIILVTDAAPNVAFRSFMFEFPWQFGIGALSCYLFGIAHTLADSSKVIYDVWIRAPVIVDTMCTVIITMPFISNNICAVAAGVYALRGDNYMASQFTDALYYLWTFYTGFQAILILYAGLRLLRLLNRHLLQRTDSRVDLGRVRLGALKVRIIVMTGFICLTVFAVMMVLYARLRGPITENAAYNVAIAVIWMFDGAITTGVIEFGVVLNPRLATLAPGFGSSAGFSGSSNRYTTGTNNITSANTQHDMTLSGGGEAGTQSQSKWMFTRSSGGRWSFGEAKSKYLSGGGDLDLNSSPKLEHKQVDPIRSQIDEDQQHYNAMTSIRAPPRNISPTNDDFLRHHQDADAETTSSATYLTMQPH
ncbi:hypothetical protein LRAMOSA00983 [Lichtheimia ramosa]|uniref:Uncharacterized protein n=1 Tax=Lichtheimia ramosa TaxID=688394 RepID=A0A077W999_9FUNG|nr:hypothetical protein LRAMOSA00983 [Lichtheimia ramosa]